MLPAAVLAAGDSTRMGRPKALLAGRDGCLFVVSIARAFAAAGVADLVIITGRDHDGIAEAVARDCADFALRVVRNPDPSRGQLSSLWAAMDATVTAETEGLMVTLVDVPLISPATIVRVADEWRRTRAPIVRPVIGERHGHPVIFDRAVFDELRQAPLEQGAKVVVRAHQHDLRNVPVTDAGCLVDVDTPEEYETLDRRVETAGSDRPD